MADSFLKKNAESFVRDSNKQLCRRVKLSDGSTIQLEASDIEIGAVEIKDGDSDQRVTVDSNGALKVTGVASSVVWERYTDAEELVNAQDLTNSYVDFGSEIDMRGYNTLGVFIVEDVNDSQDVDLKLLAKDESGGSDEYDIDSIPVERLWSGAGTDAKVYYQFDTDSIPIIQVQAKAGTVGSTAGNLTLKIVKMWK